MMNYFNRQQTLELEFAHRFINTLQRLEFFLHNVPLQMPSYNRSSTLSDLSNQLTKSLAEHKRKAIKPWLNFIQRLNNASYGITIIHCTLLFILLKEQYYKLALNMIETPGLPLTLSIQRYRHYLVVSAQVYTQFERYQDAVECLFMAHSIEEPGVELSLLILQLLVLNQRVLGLKYDKKDFIRDIGRIKNFSQYEINSLSHSNPRKLAELQFEMQLFASICDDGQLQSAELQYLKNNELLELYNKGSTKQVRQLATYIKYQIKNPILYRIKCTEIKGQPIATFETIRDINKAKTIYNYDSKQGIMYFQHQLATQEQIDAMINKACVMQQIIKKRPVDTKERQRTPEHQRFGRFKGSGGGFSGGFGGMLNNLSHRLQLP